MCVGHDLAVGAERRELVSLVVEVFMEVVLWTMLGYQHQEDTQAKR
jgi:hypothetical protein